MMREMTFLIAICRRLLFVNLPYSGKSTPHRAVVNCTPTALWTYLLGPIFAICPLPWRISLPFARKVQWKRATAISGLAEAVPALVALMHCYSCAMSTWVGNGVGVALSGKMGPKVRIQDINGAALLVWWTHPITWLLAYFGLEGAIRLCAGAFGDHSFGILPLLLADKIVISPFRRRKPVAMDAASTGAIRERVRIARFPEVPDELCFTKSESGEILEICAYRRKQDWTPPRVVRYLERYYRLETDSSEHGTRPFRYRLCRSAGGVPGRTVLLYAPPDAIIRNASPR
jgi:hypothetical protein